MNALQRILLAVILIEIPIQLDIYLDFHESERLYGAIAGWNVSVTTICLTLLYAMWIPAIAIQRRAIRRDEWRALLPAAAYLSAVAISLAVAYRPKFTLFELFSLLQAFLLFLYIAKWVRGRKDVVFVVVVILIGLVLQSAIMLGIRAVGHSINVFHITARIDQSGMRVGGTVGSPNSAATYLTLMLPLALGAAFSRGPAMLRALGVGAFVAGAAALAITMSRGGWISSVFAIVLLCSCVWWRGRLSLLAPLGLVACGLIVFAAFSQEISSRIFGYDRGSALARIPLMKMAMRIIEDHPVLGVGGNNMAIVLKQYGATSRFRGEFVYVVHNRYMQALAETGIIGLAAFLFFLFAVIHRGWRAWTRDDPLMSPIALGIAACVAGLVLRITVDTFSARALVQTLWVLAGLVTAISLLRLYSPQRPAADLPANYEMN